MTGNTKTWSLLLGVAVSALAVTAPARAQDKPAAQSDTSNGNDIIVTARRSEERLQDVPISITVVSQEALSKRNISNTTELATYIPSLSSNANFGPEKASFAIRGFTQEGKTSPSVGVYFADVIAPRANGGTTSGNGAGPGSLFDLENVQVLKGPQGTLFGRNTTGGAILLVPVKPRDKFEGSIEGTVGDYGMHRVQGILNVPINDTFRVRGAVDWNQRDGYLHNISGIGPRDFGNTNYIAARLSVVADLTPTLENYTIATYSHSSNNGVVPNVIACNSGAPGTPGGPAGIAELLAPLACAQIAQQKANGGNAYTVYNSVPNPYSRTRQWQVINTTTWQASDTITIKNIASYAEYRESSLFDLWGFNLQLPLGGGASLQLPVIGDGPGPSGNSAAQSTFTEELQIHGRNGRLDWQAGYYMELSNPLGYSSTAASIFSSCTNILAFQCTNPYQEIGIPAGSISEYSLKDTYNNKGFYAQGNYEITDKLTFTAGIRYTIDKMTDEGRNVNVSVPTPGNAIFTCQNILFFNNGPDLQHVVPVQVSGLLSPVCNLVFHQNSSKPTWLLNAEYKFTPNVMAYVKWSRGYRQGGINPNNLGFPNWGPEKVDTYEGGAKTSWHGPVPGFFNIAGFYNDFRNQQLAVDPTVALAYQASVPPQELILNAGKSRIWGIEADGSIKPFTGLQIDASYSYLNTKLISFATPTTLPPYYATLNPEAQVGGPLELAPKNRVTVTGTYTLPLDESMGRLSFGATFTHTDKQRVRSPDISPVLGELPPSNLLNVNVDWISVLHSPFDLSFFMTNVTNENHILFDDGAWGTIGAAGGHLELPRMWGFRVKWHFGS
jgi:iron complex outermembrane receptor protein